MAIGNTDSHNYDLQELHDMKKAKEDRHEERESERYSYENDEVDRTKGYAKRIRQPGPFSS